MTVAISLGPLKPEVFYFSSNCRMFMRMNEGSDGNVYFVK